MQSVEMRPKLMVAHIMSSLLKLLIIQSWLTLCDPLDCSPPGILQAKILEWVTIPFCRGSSPPRDETHVSCTAGRFFTPRATWEAQCMDNIVQTGKLHFSSGPPAGGSEVKVSACTEGDLGSIPESGRSPGEGNGNPPQYSCLENPMDGGAWWATVHGVTKGQTWLSDFISFHLSSEWRCLIDTLISCCSRVLP